MICMAQLVSAVGWCQTLESTIYENSHLIDNPLLDRKPVQIAEYGGIVVKLVSPGHSAASPSFEHGAAVRWL